MSAGASGATEPPRGWARRWPAWRARLSLQELRDLGYPDLALLRLTRPDLQYFTPTDLRLLFRIQGPGLEAGHEKLLMPPPRDGFRDVVLPWHLPELTHGQLEPYEATVRPPAAPWWEAATRGWALGALVLVLIILIVRVAEKCADRQFFKFAGGRRRRSVEWPAPTVLATTHRPIQDGDLVSSLDDTGAFSSEQNVNNVFCDLPPPYTACADTNAVTNNRNKNTAAVTESVANNEEPPPPYSACYVTYSNPKDGTSSVQFHNNKRHKVFNERDEAAHTSTSGDNAHITNINEHNALTVSSDSDNQNITENEVVIKRNETQDNEGYTRLEGREIDSSLGAEHVSVDVDVTSDIDQSDGESEREINNSSNLNRALVV